MKKKQNALQRAFSFYKQSAKEGLRFLFNIFSAYSVIFVGLILFYIFAIFVNTLTGYEVFPINE